MVKCKRLSEDISTRSRYAATRSEMGEVRGDHGHAYRPSVIELGTPIETKGTKIDQDLSDKYAIILITP
jgi:hypothetical protein